MKSLFFPVLGYRIFIAHQRKGGIHEIYRYYMDTFGNFLVCRTVC